MPHPPEQPANAREIFPAHFTFSQRYGYEPLPGPMQLEQLSDDLRRETASLTHRQHVIPECTPAVQSHQRSLNS